MTCSVLIADDSEFMRDLLRGIVQTDHEVSGEAENGGDAVELYAEIDPDVVLMDIAMPEVDGIEATAEIKETDPNAKVIICTSLGQEEKMKEAIQAGADDYITKPFEESNVRAAIDDVV